MTDNDYVAELREESWSRYRQFLIGLGGLQGEVLAAHLAIESELDRGLRRILPHPDKALRDSGFMAKVRLLQAVWPGDDPIEDDKFSFIILLNKTRNAIAHEANQDRFMDAFAKLRECAVRELKDDGDWDKKPGLALQGVTLYVSGYIAGLTSHPEGNSMRLSFPI